MNKINVLITGSTGMVGKSVLYECLKNDKVESVLIINRSSVGIKHEKLNEVILNDFFDLSSLTDDFKGIDACFYCLGVSSSEVTRDEYIRITYDMTMNFARQLSEVNNKLTFCYVSGVGTNEKENSRMFWANIKGKLENDLLTMSNSGTYLIRLGMLFPAKGIRSKTKSFDIMYRLLRPFLFIYKLIYPKGIVTSEDFGKAMINIALYGNKNTYLRNKDLNISAKLK